jgi:hypothetical protein
MSICFLSLPVGLLIPAPQGLCRKLAIANRSLKPLVKTAESSKIFLFVRTQKTEKLFLNPGFQELAN